MPLRHPDTAIRAVRLAIEGLPDVEYQFTREVIASAIQNAVHDDQCMKSKTLMTAVRHAITGRKVSFPIIIFFNIWYILKSIL